jgi:hypothetical protein
MVLNNFMNIDFIDDTLIILKYLQHLVHYNDRFLV